MRRVVRSRKEVGEFTVTYKIKFGIDPSNASDVYGDAERFEQKISNIVKYLQSVISFDVRSHNMIARLVRVSGNGGYDQGNIFVTWEIPMKDLNGDDEAYDRASTMNADLCAKLNLVLVEKFPGGGFTTRDIDTATATVSPPISNKARRIRMVSPSLASNKSETEDLAQQVYDLLTAAQQSYKGVDDNLLKVQKLTENAKFEGDFGKLLVMVGTKIQDLREYLDKNFLQQTGTYKRDLRAYLKNGE